MIQEVFKGKNGPLLIAEIGGNHEGDFEYAKRLTELAINTEVDLIKFQLYTGDTLVNKKESKQRNLHFKKFELTKEQHLLLAEKVANSAKGYLASVWSEEMLQWIDPHLTMYKIGSGDLTALPLIKILASKSKPIILSTGIANEGEVMDTVNFIRNSNSFYQNGNLAVLQCTSMYPIDFSDAHLNIMKQLKSMTKAVIGYSDHTVGYKTLAYAAAMGAQVLEFHFTDTKEGKDFRDHKVSLTPKDVNKLVEEIKFINHIKGAGRKTPLDIEIENNHQVSFRRAVYPKRSIKRGQIITEDDLVILRPLHGIDAKEYYKLIGKKAKSDIKELQVLNWDIFE